jgi:hypothetical protein
MLDCLSKIFLLLPLLQKAIKMSSISCSDMARGIFAAITKSSEPSYIDKVIFGYFSVLTMICQMIFNLLPESVQNSQVIEQADMVEFAAGDGDASVNMIFGTICTILLFVGFPAIYGMLFGLITSNKIIGIITAITTFFIHAHYFGQLALILKKFTKRE